MEFGFRLRDAAEAGKLDKVIRELENGTPIDCTSYASGKSALHIASANGHHEVVKVLLERGANVEAKVVTKG
jgi:ankyrin repeat protein